LSTIPSEEECIRLLIEEGVSTGVVAHVCTVMRVAEAIAMRCSADLSLVRSGALLHASV
jgi:HD superfamily phosphodiesterase